MDSDLRGVKQAPPSSESRSPTPVTGTIEATAAPPPKDPAIHKRNYQACIPCRNRKVKCDLGSVDSPDEPPCKRCKREKKDCRFANERRKRKVQDGEVSQEPEGGATGSHPPAPKRLSVGTDTGVRPDGDVDRSSSPELTQSQYKARAKERAAQKPPNNPNIRLESHEAQSDFAKQVTNQNEALDMLLEAAMKAHPESKRRNQTSLDTTLATLHPHITQTSAAMNGSLDPQLAESLQAWASLRFVRANIFTVAEGIAYITYYFDKMAPLTPIAIEDFRDLRTHADLLRNEPVLAVTLLTIASRYKTLPGPSARIKSLKVHDRLWDYLQGMLMRMFWGQEQFGTGFCGASGDMASAQGVDARRRSLRSLGAAESLLLLSDWLPRSMHFNPLDDCGELTLPTAQESAHPFQAPGGPNAAWVEPAQRSDRMCWSLVSMAHTLAIELGVFDSFLETRHWNPGPQPKTVYANQRAGRLGRMVYVYLTQTCGRLVYPNTLPLPANDASSNFLMMDVPEGRYPSPYGIITAADKIQRAWAELTILTRNSNSELFDSRDRTRQATQTGEYKGFIQLFGPELHKWHDKFKGSGIDGVAKTVIMIEYEHARMYVNSLGLAAVQDKMPAPGNEPHGEESEKQNAAPALFSIQVRQTYAENWDYIKEVISASRNILRMAVDGLDGDVLKHAPVRTFFRIMAGAVFLLKTVALGGRESEVLTSLNLLMSTVDGLRGSSVDDVHLAVSMADLLEILVNGIHGKLRVIDVREKEPTKTAQAKATNGRLPSTTVGGSVKGAEAGAHPLYANSRFHRPPVVNLSDPNITLMGPVNLGAQDQAGTQLHSRSTSSQLPSPSHLTSPDVTAFPPPLSPVTYSNPLGRPGSSHQVAVQPPSAMSGVLPYPPVTSNSPSGDVDHWTAADFHHFLTDPTTTSMPMQPGADENMASFCEPENPLDLGGVAGAALADNWSACGAFGPHMADGVEWLGTLGGILPSNVGSADALRNTTGGLRASRDAGPWDGNEDDEVQ